MTPADHVCTFGPWQTARFTGSGFRKCTQCSTVSLDDYEDEPLDDEGLAMLECDRVDRLYDAGKATKADILKTERALYRAIERKHR